MYFLMFSATMCALRLLRMWFCVISAPGMTSRSYSRRARRASISMSSRYAAKRSSVTENCLRPSVSKRPERASMSRCIKMWSVMAITSNRFVRPYRSTTSRSDRRPSLQFVCTWKSQSRNGSYPGTSGSHVEMLAIRRTVPQDLGPEVSHVQAEDGPLAHRTIPPRRRPHPALAAHDDAAERRQAAAEVRVLAVELDRRVEAADARERVAPHREVAAVEDRAEPQRRVHDQMRRRRDEPVVQPDERPAGAIPVVEAVRTGDRDHVARLELPLDELHPPQRRSAVRVDVRQDVASRGAPRRLARDDEPLARLADDGHAWHAAGNVARRVEAGVVDDDDFVGRPRLRQQGMQTGRKVSGFVVCADDRGDRHGHCAVVTIAHTIEHTGDGAATAVSRGRNKSRGGAGVMGWSYAHAIVVTTCRTT